ncbi:SPFH domain-containing protein [Roseococcus sp.]|uniref:SPFH domain-containing protein n=1 Tax=Roseococcus sp. TaxID=2109646 RepID=UPI003BACC867
MAVIDFVKWNGAPDILAWKFPSEELSTYTQLIVNESQEAYLVKGGVYEGPFGAGRHTLATENIPIIRALIGIPFGGQSPFSAEVWFVNKQVNMDIKWGTPDPIQLQDPKFGLMVPVRSFGQYAVKVKDSKKFLLKLVGTLRYFDAESVMSYFQGIFITRIKTEISRQIVNNKISVLEISSNLDQMSRLLMETLTGEMDEYGLHLENFNINSINLPENDPGVVSLKAALAKRAEMQIVGFNYQQERGFDVMETAAGNEGSAGTVLGAGMGIGLGAGIGLPMGQAMSRIGAELPNFGQSAPLTAGQPEASASARMSPTEKIKILRELGMLLAEGLLTDVEFAAEKQKILSA